MDLYEGTPFDQAVSTQVGTAPGCRMCSRPARWIAVRRQYGAYCSGNHCDNRERTCQECGSTFEINTNGAGTKYCSADCKTTGYRPSGRHHAVPCAWCGKPCPHSARRIAYNSVWPYICAPCMEPIKHVVDRLKAHRVPHERARQLLHHPGCEVCGTDLLAKVRAGGGKLRAALVVDHDHDCCSGDSHSCGNCVRGLICGQCNSAAGFLRDSPDYARQLATYLESWHNVEVAA